MLMPRGSRIESDLLSAALAGLEHKKAEIDHRIAELHRLLGHGGKFRGRPASNSSGALKPKRSTMSAAGRKRVAAAQRKRWAEYYARQASRKKRR